MPWPTSDVDTTDCDADGDSPLSFRQDVNDLITKFNQIRNHVSTFISTLLDDADAAAARATLGIVEVSSDINVATIGFLFDGGGAALTTGIKGDITVPFDCTISEWTLLADQSGSIVVDIWKDTYANYPPLVGDSITASAKPTITTAVKAQSSTLTGWTTAITAGDTIRFNIDSITTIQRCTLQLKVTRTVP